MVIIQLLMIEWIALCPHPGRETSHDSLSIFVLFQGLLTHYREH